MDVERMNTRQLTLTLLAELLLKRSQLRLGAKGVRAV